LPGPGVTSPKSKRGKALGLKKPKFQYRSNTSKPAPKPKPVSKPTLKRKFNAPKSRRDRKRALPRQPMPTVRQQFKSPAAKKAINRGRLRQDRKVASALLDAIDPPKVPKYVRAPQPKPLRVSPRRVGTDVPKRFESPVPKAARRDRAREETKAGQDFGRVLRSVLDPSVKNLRSSERGRQRLADAGYITGKTSAAEKEELARLSRFVNARPKRRYALEEAVSKTADDVGKEVNKFLTSKGNRRAVGQAMAAIAGGPTQVNPARKAKGGRLATVPAVQLSGKQSERAGKIGLNFAKDAIDLPAQTVAGVYYTGKPLVEAATALRKGETKKAEGKLGEAAKSIYDPYKQLVTDPKFAEEHPLVAFLMLSGAKATVGRGAGFALRKSPSKKLRKVGSTQGRPGKVVPGTGMVENRRYSKDLINKAFQVAADRRRARKDGGRERMSEKEIELRADSAVFRTQGRGKARRARLMKDFKKGKMTAGRKPSSAVVLAAQRIIATPPDAPPGTLLAELKNYRKVVADNLSESSEAVKRQQEQTLAQIDAEIKKFDEGDVRAAADAYAKFSEDQQRMLAELGVIDAAEAQRARVIPFAARYMGAEYDYASGALLRAGASRRPRREIDTDLSRARSDLARARYNVRRAEVSAAKASPKSTPELRQAQAELREAEAVYRRRRAEDRKARGTGARNRSRALSAERRAFLAYLRDNDENYVALERERGAVNRERREIRAKVQRREPLSKEEQQRFEELSARSQEITSEIKKIEAETDAPAEVLRERRKGIGALAPERKTLVRRNEAQANVRRARQKVERERKKLSGLVETRPARSAGVDRFVDDFGTQVKRTRRSKDRVIQEGRVLRARGLVVDDYGTVVRGDRKKPRSAADRLLDAIAEERRAVSRVEQLRAERRGYEDSVLATDEIRAQMLKEIGTDQAAFISQAPGMRGARMYYASQTNAPVIREKNRTGQAAKFGKTDISPDVLVENLVRTDQLINAAKSWASIVQEASFRGPSGKGNVKTYETRKYADAVAGELEAQGLGRWKPVQLAPFGSRADAVKRYLDDEEVDSELGVIQKIADTLADAAEGKASAGYQGRWVLMPEAYAVRLAEQQRSVTLGRNLDPILQGFGNVFRPTVLSTSLAWLVGNPIEGTVRSTVAGAGPGAWSIGKRVMDEVKARDPEYHDLLMEEVLSGGKYGLSGRVSQKVTSEKFTQGTNLHKFAVALETLGKAPVVRLVPQAWKHYTNFVMNTVNRSGERFIQQTIAGKYVKDQLISDKLNRLSNEAIQQAADGLMDMNTMYELGREVRKMYGKYTNLSPRERYFISVYTPFVRWAINATYFVLLYMPRDHPIATGLIAASYASSEEWRKEHGLSFWLPKDKRKPGWLQGSIPTPGGGSLRVARYTPFGAFAGEASIFGTFADQFIPQIDGVIMASKGLKWTGRPLEDDSVGGRLKEASMQILGGLIPFFTLARGLKDSEKDTLPGKIADRLNPFRISKPAGSSGGADDDSWVLEDAGTVSEDDAWVIDE
jgi:hypothetical protein